MFDDFARQVHVLVRRPETLHYDDDPDLEARLLSLRRDQLDWVAYDYLFDAGFDAGLYFLPYALEDLAIMIDGYDELADAVVIWVSVYWNSLEKLGLLRATAGLLASVFRSWLAVLRVMPDARLARVPERFRSGAVLPDGDARDSYLSHVIRYHVPGPCAEPLGNHIICLWAGGGGQPTASVHFLDMCARSVWGNDPDPVVAVLYKTELVASMVSNLTLLRKHHSQAEIAWRQYGLPEWYTRDVALALRL